MTYGLDPAAGYGMHRGDYDGALGAFRCDEDCILRLG